MIQWSDEKNEVLKATRSVCFEDVMAEIASGRFIGPEENPAHPGQMRIIVRLHEYPHIVPLVVDEVGDWFLKTIIPSRKARKAGRI